MQPSLKRTKELESLLKTLFLTLNDNNASYSVLRNHEELPAYTNHDVDILVASKDMQIAEESVLETIKTAGWKPLAEVEQMNCHSFYMYCDRSSEIQYMTIDLVSGLPWGWMETCNIDHVLSTSKEERGLRIATQGADAAMRLIKETLRKRAIKTKDRLPVISGASEDPSGFQATFRNILPENIIASLLDSAQNGNFHKLLNMSQEIRRALFIHSHIKHPIAQFVRFARYTTSRIIRFHKKSLGVFVVMIGPDGAGKTTLVNAICEDAGELLFRGSKVYHTCFDILPRIRNMARKSTGMELQEKDFTQKHSGSSIKPHSTFKTLFYLSYYCWDYFLGRIVLIKRKGRGQFIVSDRYYYDRYFQRSGSQTPWCIYNMFSMLVPKPDLILLLKADPKAVYARKPELTEKEIQRQINEAEKFTASLNGKVPVTVIHTDKGIPYAKDEALRGILNVLREQNYGKQLKD